MGQCKFNPASQQEDAGFELRTEQTVFLCGFCMFLLFPLPLNMCQNKTRSQMRSSLSHVFRSMTSNKFNICCWNKKKKLNWFSFLCTYKILPLCPFTSGRSSAGLSRQQVSKFQVCLSDKGHLKGRPWISSPIKHCSVPLSFDVADVRCPSVRRTRKTSGKTGSYLAVFGESTLPPVFLSQLRALQVKLL